MKTAIVLAALLAATPVCAATCEDAGAVIASLAPDTLKQASPNEALDMLFVVSGAMHFGIDHRCPQFMSMTSVDVSALDVKIARLRQKLGR